MSELLGANTDVLDRNAESLSTDARRVQDIATLAQRAMGELQASWNGSDLMHLTQQWEQQASPLLAGASASLDICAAQLRAQSAAQRVASSADGGSSPTTPMSMPPPASPPMRGSPADNATWWRALTALQQERVLREHPEWIGNRDGVDFTARDVANQALLSVDRDRLMAKRERLEAELAGDWSGGVLTNNDVALAHVKDKLASIVAIEATLVHGQRQLLLLDMGQERAQAAIANGNVQTADNVAVFVPGMTTTVSDDMQRHDQEMGHLRTGAEAESKRISPRQWATTATVTWMGYQAPQKGVSDVFDRDKSVIFDNTAKKGAAQLAPFLQGIGAARDHDAHLTLLGHSYGSTTAGLALQKNTGVDDAVFFGSPGLGTDHAEDLKLVPGHANYIEAPLDAVGDFGVVGGLGTDPSGMSGIQHPSAEASTVVDPVSGEIRRFKGVTGHSSYLLDNSTSQYNMSVVVAGAPDRQVYSPSGDLRALTGQNVMPHL